jgi:hypothetical protein
VGPILRHSIQRFYTTVITVREKREKVENKGSFKKQRTCFF